MLSRTECAVLKGLAILAIVAHNFAHEIPGIVRENEFGLDPTRTSQLVHACLSPDANVVLHALSFMGHYGVALFLFLSGYGLVLKYERGQKPFEGLGRFMARHYVKLLKLMTLPLLCFLGLRLLYHKTVEPVNVVAQFTMVINLLSEPRMRIQPGPFWFFGLIMQLYLLYGLLLRARGRARWWSWAGPLLFAVVCHAAQVVGEREGGLDMLIYLRYNAPMAGWSFALGLLAARYGRRVAVSRWLGAALVAVAGGAVVLMSVHLHHWLLTPAVVVLAGVILVWVLPKSWHRPLAWMGGLSAMLFTVHPIVRLLLIDYAESWPYAWLLAYMAASVLLAMAYRWLLGRCEAVRIARSARGQ